MPNWTIYVVHAVAWGIFIVARVIGRRATAAASPSDAPVTQAPARPVIAAGSRSLVVLHSIAFTALYTGLGQAIGPDRVPLWWTGQSVAGAVVILGGAVLAAWALVHFRSWRFRAAIDAGHQLATEGPFRLVRHPIYVALNLFALGSAIWVPTRFEWFAVLLMCVGSDMRARAEERVLLAAFGDRYRQYQSRTARFIPGAY